MVEKSEVAKEGAQENEIEEEEAMAGLLMLPTKANRFSGFIIHSFSPFYLKKNLFILLINFHR